MLNDTGRLSRSVEDYLKAVWALDVRGEPATTSALAEVLEVQPSSVTGMVKRLAEWGLLAHVPYRGVHLTESGRGEALRVIRRHRVIETYLTRVLGYAWEEVHDEAERLEHAASDRLVEAMAEALGDPSHDPHGAPIPTVDGRVEAATYDALAEAPLGLPIEVRAVDDRGAPALREMEELGLVPGVKVQVVEHLPGGRMRIGMSGTEETRVIDAALASLIFVVPAR
ncbi:MAG: metal-dependent transcriptional regulator [Longimicrobiales bacterium]|nr:metal-dependent transcriptional regulator [Longimicrobiales bacterium]